MTDDCIKIKASQKECHCWVKLIHYSYGCLILVLRRKRNMSLSQYATDCLHILLNSDS